MESDKFRIAEEAAIQMRRIKAILLTVDVENSAGRTYPRAVVEEAIANLDLPLICGPAGSVADVSLDAAYLKGDEMIVELSVSSEQLEAIADDATAGRATGVALCGRGTLASDGKISDLTITGVSFTPSPVFESARVTEILGDGPQVDFLTEQP